MVLCCCSFQPSLLVSMLLCVSLKVQRCRYASIFHTSGAEEIRQSHVTASGMHLSTHFVYLFSIDYKNVVSSKVSEFVRFSPIGKKY